MTAYMKNEISLIRETVWDYPAFQQKSEEGVTPDAFLAGISKNELSDLLEFSFERNYATGGLFGSRARCLPIVERLKQLGVDEIACLVDFGLPAELILQHLPDLSTSSRPSSMAKRWTKRPTTSRRSLNGTT